jgi:uncharacterized membrane protein YuzA (DUF378 family)
MSVYCKHNLREVLEMRAVNVVALVLVLIGGLNWGLVGFFDFDLVAAVLGEDSVASRVVYALVGVAALYKVIVAVSVRAMKPAAK